MKEEKPLSPDLDRLVEIMARLRDPEIGCEWDLAQNHASLARYSIEEAHEVVDAIEHSDWPALREELGDLLLQVVFHSRIAAEAGRFSLADVIAGIADKMERRHPHIFGDGENPGWDTLKAQERRRLTDQSALAGVARTLPALSRATTLGSRAASVGFDWDDISGVANKLMEELDEVSAASNMAEREDEFGDLLLTLASWGRHMCLDAETALRRANNKFERRFRIMEAATPDLASLTADQKEAEWQIGKAKADGQAGVNRDS